MKKLLLVSIFFTFAIIVPVPTMAGVDINAGISLPPPIILQAPPEVIVMPDTSGVYVVADVDADTPQGGLTGRDEKQQDQSLERGESTESKDKSDWKINVWPQKPPDNVTSPHERKEENKHVPPDRF
ncbi:MAG: hypothetical protein EHM54_06475 [Nitrospiraceae bacterium]|jgi:hypothetical protein|nr:MAG: hypothetical protein EHM54_06475 [Nitrospiraceae bacterium]